VSYSVILRVTLWLINFYQISVGIGAEAEAVLRLPRQGEQNQLNLNGETVNFTEDGRFIEFRVKSGTFSGTLTGNDVNP